MWKRIDEFGSRCLDELPAFVEMWSIIKKLPMASTPEKQRLRYQAKLKMSVAPTLSLVCPITAAALFLLSLLLTITTGANVFTATTILLLLANVMLLVCLASVYTATNPAGTPEQCAAPAVEHTTYTAEGDASVHVMASSIKPCESSCEMPTDSHADAPASTNEDLAAADMPTKSLDSYFKCCGFWLGMAAMLLSTFALFVNLGLWLGLIVFSGISWSITMAANNIVNLYMVAFVDKDKPIPVARVKVLRWIAKAIISLPLLFPVYGAAKGGYELLTSAERRGSVVIVNMFKYKMTCTRMNWFSLLGYRWVYHSFLDMDEGEA